MYMNNNFAYHMSRFMLNYLTVERNLSHNTIKSYRDTFVQLLEYILMTYNIKPENLKVDNVNREVVVDFLNYIESKKSNTITTRNTRLAALRSFFSYLQSHLPEYMFQCQQILNIKCKKKKCKNVSYLTTNEIKQLLTAPDISTRKGLRDLVLLIVLYDTGARVQELCDLVFGDVRLVSPAVITLIP